MKRVIRTLVFAAILLAMPAISLATSVDINSANAEMISSSLKGIGDKKAQAIIDYRNEHGAFQSLDDLVNVPGIGEKTLQRLRSKLSLGEK
ncbi:MAG: helix-hairpin-helix domain-containing protein [Candidatus Polarisedimenticolaceae bacterium]|nr:helix-hairpin-helix domain-containing protein [Candidatus Polarisedimenticolaceae bacterium]